MTASLSRRRATAAMLCAVWLGLGVAPAMASPALDLAALDRAAGEGRTAWGQPGLALAVVRPGAAPWLRGYGVRDLRTGKPVDAATRFGLGSCSKPFAAASVAVLVHRGRLGWDDRVVDRLPWFHAKDPWVTGALTLRDLLANRSGLRSQAIRPAALSRRAYLEAIGRSEPLHGFRDQYGYASDMFTLAGEVVAAREGASWAEVAARDLWAPLGMADTDADHRIARAAADAATPHDRVAGAMAPIDWVFEDQIAAPASGVNSSARDMAKWLAFLLGERTPGGPDTPAMALAELQLAHSPLRGPLNDSPFRDVAGVTDEAYGLGWYMMRYHGAQVFYHHGSQDGFRCLTAIAPDLGFGFAALENGPSAGLPRALLLTLLDQALERPASGWSGRFLERQNAVLADLADREAKLIAARGAPKPPRTQASYVGAYDDGGPIGRAQVRLEGRRLILRLGRETYDLDPWSGDRFAWTPRRGWPAPRQGFIDFRFAPDGQAAGLVINDHLLEPVP